LSSSYNDISEYRRRQPKRVFEWSWSWIGFWFRPHFLFNKNTIRKRKSLSKTSMSFVVILYIHHYCFNLIFSSTSKSN
jgi:uncharacterized membrane protein YvbJ